MTRHQFEPEWRGAKQPINVYENLTLKDFDKRCGAHIVRFCVSDTGRLISGDARSVLHADILQVALKLGDYNVLTAGVVQYRADGWHAWLQAIGTRKPTKLLPRLLTWLAFVGDE